MAIVRPIFYIETTIPSSYFETRVDDVSRAWRGITRAWWKAMSLRADFVTSRFVVAELTKAPDRKAKAGMTMLRGIELLAESPRVEEVATHYIEHKVMPREAGAMHITQPAALCSRSRTSSLGTAATLRIR